MTARADKRVLLPGGCSHPLGELCACRRAALAEPAPGAAAEPETGRGLLGVALAWACLALAALIIAVNLLRWMVTG